MRQPPATYMMADFKNISVCSYNCTGFARRLETSVIDILNKSQVDILCLQETWLYDFQVNKVKSVSDQYIAHTVSGMDSSQDVNRGRPHGGVAILWHKSLVIKVTVLKCNSERLCAVSIDTGKGTKMIVVTVYMPCDNMSKSVCDELFIDTLHCIEHLLSAHDYDYVCLCGDWNCDLSRTTAQCDSLKGFAKRNHLCFGWKHGNAIQGSTYCNIELQLFPALITFFFVVICQTVFQA